MAQGGLLCWGHWVAWALLLGLHAQASGQLSNSSQAQECFKQNVANLQRAANLSAGSAFGGCMDVLNVISSQCFGVHVAPVKSIKILVPRDVRSVPLWQKRAKQFEANTGIQVVIDTALADFYNLEMIKDLIVSPVHDGFIFDPALLGQTLGLNGLADLQPFLADSPSLNYDDVIAFYRGVTSVYQNKTVMLQLDGDQFLMYYRADLFKRYGLSPPETWDDFLDVARLMNGTDTDGDGKPDLLGACFDVANNCKGGYLIPAVAASYIQYAGTKQGFWFDPESILDLQPLANNAGMRSALKFWQDITPYTNRTRTCNAANADFQAGRCLMTINWGDEFKAIRRSSIAKPGMFGVHVLPGSASVLDRQSNALVSCTQQLCPFGTAVFTRETPDKRVIANQLPYYAFGGWVAGVAASRPPVQQQAAFRFISSLVAPDASWEDVLDPNSIVDPTRDSHLTDVDRWVDAGYDREVTELYLDATRLSTLNSFNCVIDNRMPYDPATNGYRAPYEACYQNVTRPDAGPQTIEQTAQVLQSSVSTIYQRVLKQVSNLKSAVTMTDLIQLYWHFIGRPGSVVETLDARKPRPPPPPPPPAVLPVEEQAAPTAIILAVAVPLAALTLIVAAAAVLYMQHSRRQQHRSLLGKVLAPGVGPNTTLVITDVQDSTTLYEVLPVSCMEKCMQLTCGVIREGIYKHNGYESATEGDSFIIAFHSAHDAVCFCIELQEALLQVVWPPELFQAEGCDSVHSVWVSSRGDVAQRCRQMLIRRAKPATQDKVRDATQSFVRLLQHRLGLGRHPAPEVASAASVVGDDLLIAQLAMETGGMVDDLIGDDAGVDDQERLTSDSWLLTADPVQRGCDRNTGRASSNKQVPNHSVLSLKPTRVQAGPSELRSKQFNVTLGSKSGRIKATGPPGAGATLKLRQVLAEAWSLDQDAHNASVTSAKPKPDEFTLVFNGLRVRCAVHSGLTSSQDVQYNKAAGRMHYSGGFLEATKAVEACAHGGQILMSQSTFSLLGAAQLPADVMLLHLGEYQSSNKKPSAAVPGQADQDVPCEMRSSKASTCAPPMATDHEGIQLYTAFNAATAPRLALLGDPKAERTLAVGLLDAPIGTVTIGFMQIVNMADIRAWNAKEAASVASFYSCFVKQQLQRTSGYLVEHVDGFVLVAFSDAFSALQWAVGVRQDMLNAPWSLQLLRYGLTEEVSVAQLGADGEQHNVVLLRGPRVKAGFDTGPTKSQVHATTGRMVYRGKVMNRAARIQGVATSAQVLCSAETWAHAMTASPKPENSGLLKMPVVDTPLKGIKDKITIYQVNASVSSDLPPKSEGGRTVSFLLQQRAPPVDSEQISEDE